MRFTILFICLLASAQNLFGQCSTYPVLSLGNDTLLCNGQSVSFSVPPGYDAYTWSTGSVASSINVNTPTTIWLQVLNESANLVVNGDFEAGNVGFSSSYVYGTGGVWGLLSNPGQYAIATSPSLTHNNFSNCADHTPTGIGNMLVANGASVANTSVWCQTIPVNPNTNYLFSAWFMNALNDPNVSNLQFFVNGVQIGPIFSTSPTGCIWQEFNDIWNSGTATTANLCINNQNTTGGGNDFAIDDISFKEVCVQTDSVVVSYDPLIVSIADDITFCANESDNFVATSNEVGTQFTWETGATGSTFSPTSSGTYTVSAISSNNCVASDSALATIIAMPWDIDTIIVGPSNCGENNGYVSGITIGTFDDPPVYTWNGPGATNPSQINASVWTDLSPGWYYFSIESNGCFRNDSAQVIPLNPPIAVISANLTSGCSPLQVTFSNSSQNATTYNWNFGNGQTANANDLSSQNQTFENSATVQLIAQQASCSDTATISITVNTCGCTDADALNFNPNANVNDGSCVYPIPPFPTVETFNVFSPNGDGINELFYLNTTNASSVEMVIINRWGNLIFQETSLNPIWAGKNTEGMTVEDGVYFYKYKVVGLDGSELEGHGFVEVVR